MTALAAGECTIDRRHLYSVAVGVGASQSLRLTYFTAEVTETVTQVRIRTGGTAAGATPTLCRVGIYSVADSGDLTLVGAIANDTTLFATGGTPYTRSLTATFTKYAGQRYAVGVLVVTAAALPTFLGQNALPSVEATVAPREGGSVSGQADLPSTVAVGSLSDNGSLIYTVVLP